MGTAPVSHDLAVFINERYDIDDDNDELRCKRCGAIVDWVTKHAAERHGDDVEVMPVRNNDTQARF